MTETVREKVTAIIAACAPAVSTTLCAWSFDGDTPVRNVEALYKAVGVTTDKSTGINRETGL